MLRINTLLITLAVFGMLSIISNPLYAAETKEFEMKADAYKYSPKTITVKEGDKVRIKAFSVDKDHGLGIKAFGVKELLPKGEWVTIEFVADKKGEYTIRCTKMCGWKHFFMKGKLIVE